MGRTGNPHFGAVVVTCVRIYAGPMGLSCLEMVVGLFRSVLDLSNSKITLSHRGGMSLT